MGQEGVDPRAFGLQDVGVGGGTSDRRKPGHCDMHVRDKGDTEIERKRHERQN